jgi:hypothetical protein
MSSPHEEQVEFAREGLRLRGMLHLPEGVASAPRPQPGVVILHGFTGNRIGGNFLPVKLSRALAGAGVASLRFDFAGSGESEGRFVEMTPLTELADARAAVELLASGGRADPERLGVAGHSLGGFVAGLLLGDDDRRGRRLRAGLLLAAPARLTRLIETASSPEAEAHMEEHGFVYYGVHEVGRRFIEDAKAADPLEAVRRSRADVLVIHGGADETVPVEHARAYEEALSGRGGARSEVVVMPEMGHAPETPDHEGEYLERAVAWFVDALGRPPPASRDSRPGSHAGGRGGEGAGS